MAQLRRNHQKGGGSNIIRVVFLFLFIMGMVWTYWNRNNLVPSTQSTPKTYTIGNDTDRPIGSQNKNMLPTSSTGEVIDKGYYTLSYNEDHEQAEWVAYELTKKSLLVKNVRRENWFEEDKEVQRGSAKHRDYTGSGYSRGHLIPAADLAFSKDAMKASMFMSNMSPQKPKFNGGVWNELENQVRNWAFDRGSVYVVTGPVLSRGHIIKKIGDNRVSVPDSFYKIILDPDEEEAIGFLIPNEKSEQRLQTYAVTIDQIEAITGIDFFADFFPERKELAVESTYDINEWKFNEDLYLKRINNWNNQ